MEKKELILTSDLVTKTLKNMGMDYSIDQKEPWHFIVQGMTPKLHIWAPYDYKTMTIRCDWWFVCDDHEDPEFIAILKETVNYININRTVCSYYTIDCNARKLGVHSSLTVLFVPEIGDCEDYLRNVLATFLPAQELFLEELKKRCSEYLLANTLSKTRNIGN